MTDAINPSHYKQGSIEFIDALEIVLAPEEFRGFLKGNAMKYLWREKKKQGIEDLRKAKWYLDRLVDCNQLAEVAGAIADLPIDGPPKRYREPTLADLANGPIECEVGDNHEKRTLIYVFPYGPARARFATVDKANPDCIGRWIDCRIEVQE